MGTREVKWSADALFAMRSFDARTTWVLVPEV
jgi:hypothetical protein